MRVREWSMRQQLLIDFFLCFLLGILAANLFGIENFQSNGSFTRYFLKQFQYAQLDFYELLWTVGSSRLMLFAALLLVGMLSKGKLVHFGFIAWSGFAFGYFCVMTISGFGAKGLLLCAAVLFPQFLVYVPVYVELALLCIRCRRRERWRLTAACALLFAVFGIGILLESYINPIILQKILNFF